MVRTKDSERNKLEAAEARGVSEAAIERVRPPWMGRLNSAWIRNIFNRDRAPEVSPPPTDNIVQLTSDSILPQDSLENQIFPSNTPVWKESIQRFYKTARKPITHMILKKMSLSAGNLNDVETVKNPNLSTLESTQTRRSSSEPTPGPSQASTSAGLAIRNPILYHNLYPLAMEFTETPGPVPELVTEPTTVDLTMTASENYEQDIYPCPLFIDMADQSPEQISESAWGSGLAPVLKPTPVDLTMTAFENSEQDIDPYPSFIDMANQSPEQISESASGSGLAPVLKPTLVDLTMTEDYENSEQDLKMKCTKYIELFQRSAIGPTLDIDMNASENSDSDINSNSTPGRALGSFHNMAPGITLLDATVTKPNNLNRLLHPDPFDLSKYPKPPLQLTRRPLAPGLTLVDINGLLQRNTNPCHTLLESSNEKPPIHYGDDFANLYRDMENFEEFYEPDNRQFIQKFQSQFLRKLRPKCRPQNRTSATNKPTMVVNRQVIKKRLFAKEPTFEEPDEVEETIIIEHPNMDDAVIIDEPIFVGVPTTDEQVKLYRSPISGELMEKGKGKGKKSTKK